MLFNMAIDFITDRLDEQNLKAECGYDDGDGPCSVLSFRR